MREAPAVWQAVSVLKEGVAAPFKEQPLMGQMARQPLLSPEGAVTETGTDVGGEGSPSLRGRGRELTHQEGLMEKARGNLSVTGLGGPHQASWAGGGEKEGAL